jgi:hypothetical protein
MIVPLWVLGGSKKPCSVLRKQRVRGPVSDQKRKTEISSVWNTTDNRFWINFSYSLFSFWPLDSFIVGYKREKGEISAGNVFSDGSMANIRPFRAAVPRHMKRLNPCPRTSKNRIMSLHLHG